jgi:redox-sensing transcriptional repressor
VGHKVGGLEVFPVEEIATRNRELRAAIGIIAAPGPAAQAIAGALVEAGVTCILNFAPVRLRVAKHVAVRAVDLSRELAVLSHWLSRRGRE